MDGGGLVVREVEVLVMSLVVVVNLVMTECGGDEKRWG
jgi:hypothetical protein